MLDPDHAEEYSEKVVEEPPSCHSVIHGYRNGKYERVDVHPRQFDGKCLLVDSKRDLDRKISVKDSDLVLAGKVLN